MNSFSLLDVLLFIGISQGLLLALSFFHKVNKNVNANKMLAIILLLASLILFGRVLAFKINNDWIWRLGTLADTSILLFAPLLYCYVRRLTFNENPIYKLSLAHYVPALVHLVYAVWTLFTSTEKIYAHYQSGLLPVVFGIIEMTGLLSFAFYWTQSVILLKRFKVQEHQHLSYSQRIKQYLNFLLGTLAILILFWGTSFFNDYILQQPSAYINYTTMWISTPLFMFVIGYFSLNQPEVFRMPIVAKNILEKDRLGKTEAEELKAKLDTLINKDELFLQSSLTLKELAEKLDTSSNNLSWLLNKVYQTSFYDYINQKRIESFLTKIQQGEHQHRTLFALAMDVGFNSKSTFNKAFKTITRNTPKDFIKKMELNV